MQNTKLVLETLSNELKERDAEIQKQKEKINFFINAVKGIQFKVPPNTELTEDYIKGFTESHSILKQKLEGIVFEITGEFGVKLNKIEKELPQ